MLASIVVGDGVGTWFNAHPADNDKSFKDLVAGTAKVRLADVRIEKVMPSQ